MEESCNWKVTNIYIYLTKNTIDKQKLAAKINLTVKLMKKKMSKSVQFLAKQEKLI